MFQYLCIVLNWRIQVDLFRKHNCDLELLVVCIWRGHLKTLFLTIGIVYRFHHVNISDIKNVYIWFKGWYSFAVLCSMQLYLILLTESNVPKLRAGWSWVCLKLPPAYIRWPEASKFRCNPSMLFLIPVVLHYTPPNVLF